MTTDIAFVTTRLTESDAQGDFNARLLEELAKRFGGKVTIFTFAHGRTPIPGVGIEWLGSPGKHGILSNAMALARTFSNSKKLSAYDVVIAAGPDIGAIPALHRAKGMRPGMRLIWAFHGLTPAVLMPSLKERTLVRLRKLVFLMSMKKSDMVKVDSKFVKGELTAAGVDPAKIVAMSIGVDLSRFSPGMEAALRDRLCPEGRFLLLYVGRLARSKNIADLVVAASILSPEVCLSIVGSGPEQAVIETLVKELKLGDKVKLAGRVSNEELPAYYRACDAWVTASRHEGFCVPIVEAMACSRPAIVPDITAMPETVGQAGLVYRHGDINSLCSKVKELMDDRADYDALSKKALERASEYSMEKVLDRQAGLILAP